LSLEEGLVTLGTPHHGSPLADSFKWTGFFIGATDAIDNLRPSYLKEFNQKFPIESSPLAENGKIYTIRGDCDGNDCFGWGGELLFGWTFITQTTNKDNDGLVPFDSAVIQGATHIWDFPDFDHLDLVQEPSVAEKASEYLINK
jgi:triacylglycerol lipase